jgi:hypothetical protein
MEKLYGKVKVMKYHLKKLGFTNQRKVIETQGDALWDAICDGVAQTKWKLEDAVKVVMNEFGYSQRTAAQYVRAVVNNVRAESGNDVIKRQGRLYIWA